ncbi:hypothetical protein D3C77_208850 [compost metagenome]
MYRLRIRPLPPARPEQACCPRLFLSIKVPPDPREAQEQLLDPLLMKTPRQNRPLRAAHKRVDYRRRLQR